MASPETYVTKDGDVSWRVKWREKNVGPQTITVYSAGDCNNLIALVNASGQRMPTREKLAAFGLEWILGDVPPPPPPAPTTADLCLAYLRFLEAKEKPPSPETMTGYWQYLADHVAPYPFAVVPCSEATRAQAREWQTALRRCGKPGCHDAKCSHPRPLSDNTVLKIRGGLVAPAFKWGTRRGEHGEDPWVIESPFEYLDAPIKIRPRKEIIATPDEAALFIECCYEVDPHFGDLELTAIATGSRFGEVSALPIRARVDGGLMLGVQKFTRGRLRVGSKTSDDDRGRFVPVLDPVLKRIDRRCGSRRPDDLMFLGPTGRRWASTTYDRRWEAVRVLLDKKGLRKNLKGHGTRDAFISALRNAGVDPIISRAASGHSSDQMQEVYTQMTPEGQAAITGALTVLLGKVQLPS